MQQKNTFMIQLPFPTDSMEKGPLIINNRDGLKIKYDYYDSDNRKWRWVEVVFTEILAYQFLQEACLAGEQSVDCHNITVFNNSQLLLQIRNNWERSVGWQDWQKQLGGPQRFKQYQILFDDEGCLDVIASQCKVNELPQDYRG